MTSTTTHTTWIKGGDDYGRPRYTLLDMTTLKALGVIVKVPHRKVGEEGAYLVGEWVTRQKIGPCRTLAEAKRTLVEAIA
jgi:hypothetical protein